MRIKQHNIRNGDIMQIMIPDKETGGLKTKTAFLTKEERRIMKEDNLQNCCPPRTRQEQGFEPLTFNERLEYGMAI